jgi:hypothetical protein
MALASDAAGVTLRVTVRSGGARRRLTLVTGALSITVGAAPADRSGRFHPRVHGAAPVFPRLRAS